MADWTTIIAEFVAGAFIFAGVLVTNSRNHQKSISEIQTLFQKQNAEQDKQFQKQNLEIKAELTRYEAVNDQKLSTLTKQVEKHNEVVERTYKLERDVAIMKMKMGLSGGNSDKE